MSEGKDLQYVKIKGGLADLSSQETFPFACQVSCQCVHVGGFRGFRQMQSQGYLAERKREREIEKADSQTGSNKVMSVCVRVVQGSSWEQFEVSRGMNDRSKDGLFSMQCVIRPLRAAV